MYHKKIFTIAVAGLAVIPFVAFADTSSNQLASITLQLTSLLTTLSSYINQLPHSGSSTGGTGGQTSSPNYFQRDQAGSIELGIDPTPPAWTGDIGVPYIDFHYGRQGTTQDFNTRIINDASGQLSVVAPTFLVSGRVGIGQRQPGFTSMLRVVSTDQANSWITTHFSGNNNTTNHFIFQTDSDTGNTAIQLRGKERTTSPETPFVNFFMPSNGAFAAIQGTVSTLKIVANTEIGSSDVPRGITLYDKTTKQPYCVTINNGGLVSAAGVCN